MVTGIDGITTMQRESEKKKQTPNFLLCVCVCVLCRVCRMALETEEIGMGILGELDTQRETIITARGRLRNTDGTLRKSMTVLRGMIKRAYQNKALMFVLMFAIVGVIVLIIYIKVVKKK